MRLHKLLLSTSFTLSAVNILFAQQPQTKQTVSYTGFTHPGMVQNHDDLEYMKQQVLNGSEPWKDAFEKLKKETAAKGKPKAITHLSQGPYGSDDFGGKQLTGDAESAYDNALMWYITRNPAYAVQAEQILNLWSDTLWDFDDNNAKLLAGLTGYYLLNAAEILRYSDAGWKEKDIHQFKKLMLTVYYPLIKDFFPEANGNWDAAMTNTMLCIGVFCDDHQIFDQAVNRFYRGNGNGGITKYIYPGGQVQESSRDWNHVQLGIGEFAKAAQVAWTQGIDFYSVAGCRLAQGFEYAEKVMLGDSVPVYGNLSKRGRQTYRDIYESIFDHYHNLLGMEMSYTKQVIAHTRPTSSLGLLTAIRKPALNKPKPLKPSASLVLRDAGALNAPTAKPTREAVYIKPGQSIQHALDSCSKNGGAWVVLLKGVHFIKEPLRLHNLVTLSGQGNESILSLEPEARTKTIVNAERDLHDVVLRDFLIEGATTITEGEDPNNNRRTRANQNAASREGIIFLGDREGEIKNIKLVHITVQNFTKNGVSIKGAEGITVDSCNFSDNGSSVVPGPGLHDNLNLSHVARCYISNSRFDSSPWGNGIKILLGSQIIIKNCEAARNRLAGISCAEVSQVAANGNLTEGNDRQGILLQKLIDGNNQIEVQNNFSNNNGLKGIDISATNKKVINNIIADNGINGY